MRYFLSQAMLLLGPLNAPATPSCHHYLLTRFTTMIELRAAPAWTHVRRMKSIAPAGDDSRESCQPLDEPRHPSERGSRPERQSNEPWSASSVRKRVEMQPDLLNIQQQHHHQHHLDLEKIHHLFPTLSEVKRQPPRRTPTENLNRLHGSPGRNRQWNALLPMHVLVVESSMPGTRGTEHRLRLRTP